MLLLVCMLFSVVIVLKCSGIFCFDVFINIFVFVWVLNFVRINVFLVGIMLIIVFLRFMLCFNDVVLSVI